LARSVSSVRRSSSVAIGGTAAQGTLATAQTELSFENIKDLLDFGVVMRPSAESWSDRKLKQRALLGVFSRDQRLKRRVCLLV
jgi:hypothetical protein